MVQAPTLKFYSYLLRLLKMKFSQKLAVHISTESRGASLYLCVHEREHILEPHEVRNLDDKKI